jgi:hypothetical protein
LSNRTPDPPVATRATAAAPGIRDYFFILAQLAIAVLVAYLYRIEGVEFLKVFALASCGFVVQLFLPARLRLEFFVLLSLTGVFVVFSLGDALWMIGCGLVLIGICHVPIPFAARIALLVVIGAALAASRSGFVAAPWSSVVWPILGSMFMFRLIIYLRAVMLKDVQGGFWAALAYFFMLPNLVFPLFPVIDYQTFRRTHFDRQDLAIYEQGLLWISRGLVHLVLYRLVYHNFLADPGEVSKLSDLVQFMLGTFLLYLRVSGTFHLIVGMLHLFGFRLPETHRLYYLAHDFTELWRRINIYWKDFMTKVVFYPAYFRLKALGPTRALAWATVAVFFSTWLLHSYQWFWLRGGFPITLPDILFWGFLGGLVAVGALREARAKPAAKSRPGGWDLRRGLNVAGTFGLFCTLWSLWSTESVTEWLLIMGAALTVDGKGLLWLGLAAALLTAVGGLDWKLSGSGTTQWLQSSFKPSTRTMMSLLILVVAGQASLQVYLPETAAEVLRTLKMTGLNARDAALQHRGYYEQLNVRATVNDRVLDVAAKKPPGWQDLASLGLVRERQDLLLRELYPSRRVVWNGLPFSTNSHGMRDREYALEKTDGTFRIALLGPSHVMGNGVGDSEVFESLVENRLNRERPLARFKHYEVLNFGLDGHGIAQQVALLEDKVIAFDPDVVIVTSHRRDMVVMEQYLLKIVWRQIPLPHEALNALLDDAGLANIDRGDFPLPFAAVRSVARKAGLDPRMPESEADFRVRRISADMLAWWYQRYRQVADSHGILPVVLALNAVIDDPAPEVVGKQAIADAGLKVIDLLDIYPQTDRPKLRVASWDDHPNAAGHEIVADRLYPELVRLLESAQPR